MRDYVEYIIVPTKFSMSPAVHGILRILQRPWIGTRVRIFFYIHKKRNKYKENKEQLLKKIPLENNNKEMNVEFFKISDTETINTPGGCEMPTLPMYVSPQTSIEQIEGNIRILLQSSMEGLYDQNLNKSHDTSHTNDSHVGENEDNHI